MMEELYYNEKYYSKIVFVSHWLCKRKSFKTQDIMVSLRIY